MENFGVPPEVQLIPVHYSFLRFMRSIDMSRAALRLHHISMQVDLSDRYSVIDDTVNQACVNLTDECN